MPDLPVDRLGPYPILQFAAALLVMGGLAIAVWRGMKDRKGSGMPGDQWLYLDGPIDQVLELLRELKRQNYRLIELKEEHINLVRDANGVLRDIKNLMEFFNRR